MGSRVLAVFGCSQLSLSSGSIQNSAAQVRARNRTWVRRPRDRLENHERRGCIGENRIPVFYLADLGQLKPHLKALKLIVEDQGRADRTTAELDADLPSPYVAY